MKKVFFFIPTLSVGGGERVVSELSLNLPENIERTIVLMKQEVSYPYKGNLISLDVSLERNFFLKLYWYLVALARFRKLVRKEKPDYVISFGHIANIINILSGARAIVRADNFFSYSLNGLGGIIYQLLIKLLFNKAYMVVPVAEESARDLIEHFGVSAGKITVIYNPVDIPRIGTLTTEALENVHKPIFEHPVVISMGRLHRQKGQWHLIKAFKKVKEKVGNAKLVILGTGELERVLQKLAEDVGIKDDVHFLGWQKNPFKFIAKADVFVLSSLWEGLPYVLLEAMACGVPVISADCRSGPREIIAPQLDRQKKTDSITYGAYGILTQPYATKDFSMRKELSPPEVSLAQAMISLLQDQKLIAALKEKSARRVNDFSIEKIVKQWYFLSK